MKICNVQFVDTYCWDTNKVYFYSILYHMFSRNSSSTEQRVCFLYNTFFDTCSRFFPNISIMSNFIPLILISFRSEHQQEQVKVRFVRNKNMKTNAIRFQTNISFLNAVFLCRSFARYSANVTFQTQILQNCDGKLEGLSRNRRIILGYKKVFFVWGKNGNRRFLLICKCWIEISKQFFLSPLVFWLFDNLILVCM